MPNSITNNAYVAHIAEATWGTTPAVTPAFKKTRWTSITPTMEKGTMTAEDSLNSREVADIIQVSARGGLQFGFNWHYGAMHDYLESLLASAWAADVLKVGKIRKSLSVELGFTDIAQYAMFRGAIVNSIGLQVAQGRPITGTMGFVSKFPQWANAVPAGATYTSESTNPIGDPLSSIQVIQEGGAGTIVGPTELSFTLSSNIIELPQLGSVDPVDLFPGSFKVEGEFSAYFADRTYIDKFVNWSASSIKLDIGGAAALKESYHFKKVKLKAVGLPIGGINQPVVQRVGFEGYYDAVETMTAITRTP